MFSSLGLPAGFVSREVTEMTSHQMTKTASRGVLGTMNDFAYLADAHRTPNHDPYRLDLSVKLARAPYEPLYRSRISPDREISAYLADHNR